MGRAPCCDKMGLKKGPWTPEEDQILISYIQKYGHANWRALPKLAGLLRCGKSCRLRWTNYLRPDIKRGNFTSEEEETIIKMHEMLGNRWSAIAAKLPGRTDNEIKNVWHTHLKKRLKQYQTKTNTKSKSKIKCESSDNNIITTQSESGVTSVSSTENNISETPGQINKSPMSPQPSSSEVSSITDATTFTTENMDIIKTENMDYSWEYFPEIDESFWSEAMSSDNSSTVPLSFEGVSDYHHQFQYQQQVPSASTTSVDCGYSQNLDDAMEFWYDLFIKAGGEQELISQF